jgi:hypothetical protein
MPEDFTRAFGLPDFVKKHAPKLELEHPEEPRKTDRELRRLVVHLYANGHQQAATFAARGDIRRALQEVLFDVESEGLRKRVMPQRPVIVRGNRIRPMVRPRAKPAPQPIRRGDDPYDYLRSRPR